MRPARVWIGVSSFSQLRAVFDALVVLLAAGTRARRYAGGYPAG
jgi:hypothetical protein